jgi:hypothetical protein
VKLWRQRRLAWGCSSRCAWLWCFPATAFHKLRPSLLWLLLFHLAPFRLARCLTAGLDERQSAWLDGATPLRPSPASAVPTTFPNVPFEEGKARKNKRA